MTTTTAPARVPAAAERSGRDDPLVGTGALVRVALRFDRWRILVWAVAVAGMVQVSVDALAQVYADPATRAARATLISSPRRPRWPARVTGSTTTRWAR
ncbi:hypothetical protein [Cellulomonas septica]|uniref:hypothetical protein n=1 Tax=Cellulomonas septica TaxID=285080 RepID=UPI001FE9CE3F|nr:hypothetical protein [Cellulomonas septica]